eukprot:s5151_g2.t1
MYHAAIARPSAFNASAFASRLVVLDARPCSSQRLQLAKGHEEPMPESHERREMATLFGRRDRCPVRKKATCKTVRAIHPLSTGSARLPPLLRYPSPTPATPVFELFAQSWKVTGPVQVGNWTKQSGVPSCVPAW